MAERWQQWMPFHIDRWKGSPHVQAMRAAARAGYLYLLATAWQTDFCCLPDDDEELMVLAGLTHEEWAQYGPTIRRRFVKTENGLRNEVEFEEWQESKRIFEKNHGPTLSPEELSQLRSQAGRAGAAKRWQKNGKRMASEWQKDSKPIANDSLQMTGTGTITKTTTKTLASTAIAVPAARGKLVCTLPLNQGEHEVFEADVQQWQALYPAVDVRQELRSIKGWSLASPQRRKTKSGIGRFINSWLSRAQNEAKPGGGNGNRNSKTGGNLDAAAQAIAFLEQADRDSQALDEVQPQPASCDQSGNAGFGRGRLIDLPS